MTRSRDAVPSRTKTSTFLGRQNRRSWGASAIAIALVLTGWASPALVALLGLAPAAASPATERVSVSSTGAQANFHSRQPSISHDGFYVAFVSDASNLVAGDTNRASDVFVRDRAGTAVRVSVSSTGGQADGASDSPSISSDGRYVVFQSDASNLVSGDTNGVPDVFLHDRATRTTTRVSVAGTTQGNGVSSVPAISANGGHIAFQSAASNLVAGDTNQATDIFVWNRSTKALARASVSWSGAQAIQGSYAPAISRDGRYVAFASWSHDLAPGASRDTPVQVYRRDMVANATVLASALNSGAAEPYGAAQPAISGDGQRIAYSAGSHVYVRNLALSPATTVRASVSSAGAAGDGDSYEPAISDDGNYVAFVSWSTNLAPGDANVKTSCQGAFTLLRGTSCPDLFVRDLPGGTTRMDSVTPLGTSGNDASGSVFFATPGESSIGGPAITKDGATTAFASAASDLVQGDTNQSYDIFVRNGT